MGTWDPAGVGCAVLGALSGSGWIALYPRRGQVARARERLLGLIGALGTRRRQGVGSQGAGSRDAELPGESPGARSEPAGGSGRAGSRECLLNAERPGGGGEATGHRRRG